MSYLSHNSVIVCKPRSCSKTNRTLSSTTPLAFQGIPPFYTPRQTRVSGMSPVQSVRDVPGLHRVEAPDFSPGRVAAHPRRTRPRQPFASSVLGRQPWPWEFGRFLLHLCLPVFICGSKVSRPLSLNPSSHTDSLALGIARSYAVFL